MRSRNDMTENDEMRCSSMPCSGYSAHSAHQAAGKGLGSREHMRPVEGNAQGAYKLERMELASNMKWAMHVSS